MTALLLPSDSRLLHPTCCELCLGRQPIEVVHLGHRKSAACSIAAETFESRGRSKN